MLVVMGLIALVVEASVPGLQDSKNAQKENRITVSFIKKHLMTRLKPEMATSKRDPFRPVTAMRSGSLASRTLPSETETPAPKSFSILESLSLSCSGLVISGNKKMALILVDGQAITLAEGEEFIPGIRLTRISGDEITFQDDQGNSRKVRVKER